MKKINVYLLVLVAVLISSSTVFAQKDIDTSKAGYTFEILKKIPATVVKDQYRSGTCWSFSGLSFFESELLRMKKDTFDLSEMYVVRMVYRDKAEKYVRYHGSHGFGGGGASHDVPYVIKKYGMLPESVYAGLNYGEKGHTHGELDNVTKGYCDAVMKNEKKLTEAWLGGFNGILDAYLGEIPDKFTYKGKEYTPQSYAKELGIVAEDYIKITSYSHHPFYEKFILEVPDNWANGEVYNVPLNELMESMKISLDKVISLNVPDELIVGRITGRRVCSKCGASFHVEFNPSKEENICDYCGSELIIRKDDNAETVKSRLEAYHSQTAPLIDFYTKMGLFIELDGTKDVSDVTKDMINALS